MLLYAVITLALSSAVFAGDDGFCSTNTAAAEVDKILPAVNDQIKAAGSGTVDAFKVSFYPRVMIVLLFPFHVFLETSAGTVTNLNTLTQNNATYSQCDKNAHSRDMAGKLKYGTLEVTFDKVKAGFWGFEFEGKMTYKISPVVPFTIHQDSSKCAGFPSTSYLSYGLGAESLEFEAPSGWGIISKITSFFLLHGDDYGALYTPFEEAVVSPIKDHFIKYWCDNHQAP